MTYLLNLQVILFLWFSLLAYQIWKDYPRWQPVCLSQVGDGDSITYYKLGDYHKQYHGRLYRIDAFEMSQKPWGKISHKKLEQYLKYNSNMENQKTCQQVYLKVIKKDYYQRNLILLKKNRMDKITINETILANGWAMLYPASDWNINEKAKWKKIQQLAKLEKKGIWKYPKKFWQMPWSFRKNTLSQLERRKDYDQRFSGPVQRL